MPLLHQQRCLNHESREAAARCPECRQYYCRECVTEHDDRVICTSCLKKLVKPKITARLRLDILLKLMQAAFGLIVAWLFFFLIGSFLLSAPSSFHEGTLWQKTFWEDQ